MIESKKIGDDELEIKVNLKEDAEINVSAKFYNKGKNGEALYVFSNDTYTFINEKEIAAKEFDRILNA